MLLLFNGVNTAAGCMSSQVNYFGEDSAVTAAGVVVDVTQQTQCSPSSSVEQPCFTGPEGISSQCSFRTQTKRFCRSIKISGFHAA